MQGLNQATRRRLLALPQLPHIWEGDSQVLPLGDEGEATELDTEEQGVCILWVDGVEGMVRSMDLVSTAQAGPEAMVRALIEAMERPKGPVSPARPQKILVRDRQLQLFLRGVLQDLNIKVEHAAELPLIQEVFESLLAAVGNQPPSLPPQYVDLLETAALQIWQDAPWEALTDNQVLAITLNQWDIDTLYVSLMGNLGMEFGALLYRSLESLQQFYQQASSSGHSQSEMEAAFLQQDCLFVNFDLDPDDLGVVENDDPEIQFGSLHPLEGMRPELYEEEAIAVYVALEALHRFYKQHRTRLRREFPALSTRLKIDLPAFAEPQQITVTVATQPEIADALLPEMSELTSAGLEAAGSFGESTIALQDTLVPEGAFFSIGGLPWEMVQTLHEIGKVRQPGKVKREGDLFPIILIQTSQPKAKRLIEQIEASGGIQAAFFQTGLNPFSGDRFDLGILSTQAGQMELFGEFEADDPVHIKARKKWDQRCKKTGGWCGLVIAKGVTGVARGNPSLRDLIALYEMPCTAPTGLGTLTLMPMD
ncbi:MAG: hypothetical protein KME35_08720 [Aphanocapsa sp. GSE-SYN-MK-11-07L]|jgi:hypothetical protein|nr:hypothetical protein [Aphanocapsa sp. GSE-SYN-MK-11-07L]